MALSSYAVLLRRRTSGTIPPSLASRYRDWQILDLIGAALAATAEFDAVATSGTPEERGLGAYDGKLAILDIDEWIDGDEFDDYAATPQLRDVRFRLTIAVRIEDADMRSRELARLCDVAANAINGKTFGGVTHGPWTGLRRGKYLPAVAPERRVVCQGTFRYDLEDYLTHNTVPDTGS